jgi:uncharacterized RDD family membrane protein YckC
MAAPLSAAQLAAQPTPSLRRRAACLLYELVVLFGVALLPGLLSTWASRFVPAASQTAAMQFIGFACFGLYFVWMWTHSGQTLPMQTWRIQLVTEEGHLPSTGRALLRYLAGWLWVAPAVVPAHLLGWQRWWALGATAAWACCYGAAALLLPGRQFLHDTLCKTRLVTLPR